MTLSVRLVWDFSPGYTQCVPLGMFCSETVGPCCVKSWYGATSCVNNVCVQNVNPNELEMSKADEEAQETSAADAEGLADQKEDQEP